MNILLLGPNGQVGWELRRALTPLGAVIAAERRGQEGLNGDLTDPDGLIRSIREVRPSVIVNAAAYTAVDKAETEPDQAQMINTFAPGILAEQAQKFGALLVHYSTDYVFNGEGNALWEEEDEPDPINTYGLTKLQGEQAIRDVDCRHLIFRTSWVYAARGHNFPKTMLQLAAERDAVKVVNDQFGSPTGAELIADSTAHAIRTAWSDPDAEGLYHLTASGETNWYEYACFVIETARNAGWPAKINSRTIEPVSTGAFSTAAQRPQNCRLNCTKFEGVFGLELPHWHSGVERMLAEIMTNESWNKRA